MAGVMTRLERLRVLPHASSSAARHMEDGKPPVLVAKGQPPPPRMKTIVSKLLVLEQVSTVSCKVRGNVR